MTLVFLTEKNLELQYKSSTNTRTDLNKYNSDWKHNPVESINLVHYRDRIYVLKKFRKCVLKWYHCYLQNPCGNRLAEKLTAICRWSVIFHQEQILCITCKYCHKFKRAMLSMGYFLIRMMKSLRHGKQYAYISMEHTLY